MVDDPGVPVGACPTLTPAYGRDYKSWQGCVDDFEAGKDFILNLIGSRWNGKPCSIRDLKGQFPQVTLRFNGKEDVYIYKFA